MFFAKTRFFTNGLHMEDGEVIGPRNFESWRCASFLFVWFLRRNWFSGLWTFHDFSDMFRDFWRKMSFSKNDPEVPGSARGGIPDLFRAIFDKCWQTKNGNHVTTDYYNNSYKSCLNYSVNSMLSMGVWRMGLGCSGKILACRCRRRRRRRPPGILGGGQTLAFPETKSQKCAARRIYVIWFLKLGLQ